MQDERFIGVKETFDYNEVIFDGKVHDLDANYSYCIIKKCNREIRCNKMVKFYVEQLLINIFFYIQNKRPHTLHECIKKLNTKLCILKPVLIIKPPHECSPLYSYGTIGIKFNRID